MDHRKVISALLAGVVVSFALTACQHTTQTTSGQDYLGAYRQPGSGGKAAPIDSEIREAAAVEPLLRFPARIGLARIGMGHNKWDIALTGVPENEAVAWQQAAKNLGPAFGEFVPVSPLIAEMFPDSRESYGRSTAEIVRKIRLAAARQHLDTVIIYESDGTADNSSNPLSIGEWTLIGLFVLPSQDVNATGIAQAMMIDVRNGYPYGTARAQATDSSITVRVATGDTKRDLAESVRLAAVKNLAPEVEKMMRQVKSELTAKRLARGGK